MIVQNIIENRTRVYLLQDDTSVYEAARYLREKRIGGAPVVRDGKLVGFCSERDLVFRVLAQGLSPEAVTVGEIMTHDVVTAGPEDSVEECEQKLRKAHCRHLPILKDGAVIACLSMRDFLQSELHECKLHVEHLTKYIQGSS